MLREDIIMKTMLRDINEAMTACKNGLKSIAMLRKITSLRPVTDNPIRWSAMYNMLRRFNRIRSCLFQLLTTMGPNCYLSK